MKALHVFYKKNIDSKIASSVIYEYFYKYRKDVDMYKFHYIDELNNNIDINNINKKDVIAFVGLNILTNHYLIDNIIILADNNNEIYWIEEYDPLIKLFNNDRHNINKIINMNNINIISDPDFSLSYNVYNYFKTIIKNEEIKTIPMTLYMLNEFIKVYNPPQETYEFIFGLYCTNFSAKNFFKNIFNGSKLADIFEYSKSTSKIEHEYIKKIENIGKDMYSNFKKINNKEKLKHRGFEAFIIDIVYDKCYSCYIINCADPSVISKNITSEYDFTCTFIKLANGKWKHTFKTNIDCIDIDFIANALFNNEKHYYCGSLISIKDKEFTLITNNCIFNHSNRIIIYKNFLSKKIKVKYDTIN